MQKNPGHQPERFEVYTELDSGLGFKIAGSNHIFYYDKYGGWKDQYGNYYNSDGRPDEEPDDVSEKTISDKSWSDEDEDQFEEEFGPKAEVQDQFENEPVQSQVQETIAKNIAELELHQKNQPLRVNFEILDIQPQQSLPAPKELYYTYQKKVKGILNVFYDEDEEGERNTGYFVVKDVKNALKLIDLQGKDLVGFDISFEVQTFQQLLNDPISQFQLQNTFPKFVSLEQNEKLYIVQLETGGFTCSKDQFIKWLGTFGLGKDSIQKMIKGENKEKKPVLKIKLAGLEKIKQAKFGDKKVVLEEYKPPKEEPKQEKTQQPSQETTNPKQQQTQATKIQQAPTS